MQEGFTYSTAVYKTTRVVNVIKRSKSRIKLNANTSVDVLLKFSTTHFKMAIFTFSKLSPIVVCASSSSI